MANFNGTARSNYFRVKDAEAFKAWAEQVNSLGLWEKSDGYFGVYSECPDTGCFPSGYWDEETGEYTEFELSEEIAKHLVDGDVCVLMEAGAEKMRYVSGWAQAFDNSGEVVQVSLVDIYDKAKLKFGVSPTPAEY